MSTIPSLPVDLRTILQREARDPVQRVGGSLNVAEALEAARQQEIRLGTAIDPAEVSDRTSFVEATAQRDEAAELAPEDAPPPETTVPLTTFTPQGIQTQFLTGTQLDRLV